MKKSLIALAVMAAAGAASAQSSVQLYGIADLWFGSVKAENGAGVGVRQTVLESGGVSNSRWGLKGSEDLGGGLKAIFTLEQGFNMDDGAGTGFNREASVGLAGNFGEVKFGKVWTAFDDLAPAANSAFDSDLAPTALAFVSNGYSANPANGVRYTSPSISGFTAAASYALGENKTATLSASSVTAVNVQYANGPITAGVAYQTEEPQGNGKSVDYTLVNGSYNFGPAKLLASYAKVDDQGLFDTNEWHLGVDVPLASNLILSGGYAQSKTETAAGADVSKRKGLGLALAYVLSKRTIAYTGLNNTKFEDGAGNSTGKVNVLAVGIKHSF